MADIATSILYTTNCLMPVKPSYHNRAYTASIMAYLHMIHVKADQKGHKDFSALIDHTIKLGGYP